MIRILILTIVLTALYDAPVYAVTFNWATIGSPGNSDDTRYGHPGYGSVDYTYSISKFEVTNAQYAAFLNSVDPAGINASLGGFDSFLYHPQMSSAAVGGINLNGSAANGSKYQVKPAHESKPVVFVTFFDAMRFVNWLENGQGSGGTEVGVYTIGNGTNEVRNVNATYFIPNEDEWYKAAYYDPAHGTYYDYPTGTNTEPFSDNPSSLNTPDNSNVANFKKYDGLANGYDDGFAVTGSQSFVGSQDYLTDVGAYALSESPNGTFDQGGNAWEMNETRIGAFSRGLRGGYYEFGALSLHASDRRGKNVDDDDEATGFRIARAVPEPATNGLALAASLMLAIRRRVKR